MRGGEVIEVDVREVSGPADTALVVSPHPLTVQGQRILDVRQAALLPGETLAVFLARHGVLEQQQWAVSLGGIEVPEALWPRVRPKHGHLIEARRVPGKQALQIVALIALTYFTAGIGSGALAGTLGSSFAAGTIGASLAAGAVFLAGSMVINKLLGPKPLTSEGSSSKTTSPSYALQGGRNRSRPFEPMGLVLGEPYCVPDLSAQPYVFFANDEQYLFQIFHAGLNCASVRSISNGATLISAYEGVTLSYDGMASGNTGFLGTPTSVDTVAGGLLDADGSAPGPWVTRTTSAGAIQIAIDMEFQLSAMDDKGRYQPIYVEIGTECRLVGEVAWQPLIFPAKLVGHTGGEAIRQTWLYSLPVGQYEIRLQKRTLNTTKTTEQNVVSWTSLKTQQQDTGSYAGQARVGVQIKATGQLNGALDEINWIATAKAIPFWNGGTWVTATSRANGLSNPGAQILMLARGIYDENSRLIAGLGLPDSQIDIEGLKGFMVFCTQHGFTFDYFLQETTSIGDLIDAIAAAGMGSRSWHTGKMGVIWFADSQPIEGVLNMTTMKVKSFTVDYDTQATAEEIEFQYFDRERSNSWQSIRVLAPGITSPTSTARQQLVGVTTEAQASVLARFSMAQNVYQRKTVTCEIDLEHLVFRRGTVIALSHDVTQWGYGGRVQGVSVVGGVVTFTLDDLVPSSSPAGLTSRYIGLRLPGERSYRVFGVQAFAGETRTVRLVQAWPAGAQLPGTPASDGTPNPVHDTLWIYDFKATPGQKLRIADIAPQGNMDGARLALVPEVAEFWNYVWTGEYLPPPNNSLLRQDLPEVVDLTVDVTPVRQGDAWLLELTVTFTVLGNYGSAQLWAAVDGNTLAKIGPDLYGGRVTWMVQRGQTWTIEIRPFDTLGRMGKKGQASTHVAVAPPDAVDGLVVAVESDGVVARWSLPFGLAYIDYAVTQLREGATWDSAGHVFEGRADSYRLGWLEADAYTFWASHRNTAGDWSTPVHTAFTVLPPLQADPHATVNNRNQVSVAWQDCKATQPLAIYEVRRGDTWATATVIAQTRGTTFDTVQNQFGEQRYWVVAIDVAGNRGAPGYAYAVTLESLGSSIGSLRGKVDAARDEIAAMQMRGDITAFEQLGKAKAGIYEKIEVVVTDTTALASKYEAVSAQVEENQALVTSQITTLATEQSAQAIQLNLVAAVSGANTAAIAEESTARTTAISALASLVSTIQSSVGGLTASVEIQSNTLASLNGNVAAQWMVRTEAVGSTGLRGIAGIMSGVSSSSGGGAPQSEIVLFADRTLIASSPSTATAAAAMLRAEGGVVYIDMAVIKNADIGTLKIGGDAIGTALASEGSGTASVAFTVPAGQIWRAVSFGLAGNGPEYAFGYTQTLQLTGATSGSCAASVVGASEGPSSTTYTFRTQPTSIGGITEYGAGGHTITLRALVGADVIATPLLLLVNIQKRGA